jgi:hypothetical protein
VKKDAIQEIAAMAKNEIHKVNDLEYTIKGLTLIKPPTPDALKVFTLQAIVDYIEFSHTHHDLEKGDTLIHVTSFDKVVVTTSLDGSYQDRDNHLKAECSGDIFRFDSPHEPEQFIIKLQSQFVQDEVTAQLLNIVGNLTTESVMKIEDDGVTQSVNVKKGIVEQEEKRLPNPVLLRPYRTFPEVDQPASNFVFRMDSKGYPTCALYEADGGAWKLEAINSIAKWLADKLPDVKILA